MRALIKKFVSNERQVARIMTHLKHYQKRSLQKSKFKAEESFNLDLGDAYNKKALQKMS